MIRYERFSKRFGALTAVHALDLQLRPGECLALVGPNGSGKSTTLKAALGLVCPTAGRVWVGPHDVTRAGRVARRGVGYLPQRLGFPDGFSAREVLRHFARLRGVPPDDAMALLERVGLASAADRPADRYSGGMRQRLGLAVALLGEPAVLVLDEPTAALDPTGSLDVRDLIMAIRAAGTSVLISSHDLGEVAALADRLAIFVAGRCMALGTIAELGRAMGDPTASVQEVYREATGAARDLAWIAGAA